MQIVKETRQVVVNSVVIDGKSYDLHPWAQYVAIDKDGEVWQYDDEPRVVYDLYWSANVDRDHCDLVTTINEYDGDWMTSLTKVGEE